MCIRVLWSAVFQHHWSITASREQWSYIKDNKESNFHFLWDHWGCSLHFYTYTHSSCPTAENDKSQAKRLRWRSTRLKWSEIQCKIMLFLRLIVNMHKRNWFWNIIFSQHPWSNSQPYLNTCFSALRTLNWTLFPSVALVLTVSLPCWFYFLTWFRLKQCNILDLQESEFWSLL